MEDESKHVFAFHTDTKDNANSFDFVAQLLRPECLQGVEDKQGTKA